MRISLKTVISCLVVSLFAGASARASVSDTLDRVVKAQCLKMLEAFIRTDMATYVSFIEPTFLEKVGGRDSIVRQLMGLSNEIQGVFSHGGVSKPSKLFEYNNTIQCLLTDTLYYTKHSGTDSSLAPKTDVVFAISTDNGVNWKFLNIGEEHGESSLPLQMLPELAPGTKDLIKKMRGVLR